MPDDRCPMIDDRCPIGDLRSLGHRSSAIGHRPMGDTEAHPQFATNHIAPVATMTRRAVIMAAVFSILSAVIAGLGKSNHKWALRARRRWESAVYRARSAERRKHFARRSAELCEWLEKVDVEPSRREELRRDIARTRSWAERDAR